MPNIEQYKVNSLPDYPTPNSIYYLKSGNEVVQYVTDASGRLIAVFNTQLTTELVNRIIADLDLGGISGIILGTISNEEPIGARDGVNRVFTTISPFITKSSVVHVNGQRMKLGSLNDYTETAANQITFNFDIATTDQLIIDYTVVP